MLMKPLKILTNKSLLLNVTATSSQRLKLKTNLIFIHHRWTVNIKTLV